MKFLDGAIKDTVLLARVVSGRSREIDYGELSVDRLLLDDLIQAYCRVHAANILRISTTKQSKTQIVQTRESRC